MSPCPSTCPSVAVTPVDSAGFLTNGCWIDSFPPAIFGINACPPHYRSRLPSPWNWIESWIIHTHKQAQICNYTHTHTEYCIREEAGLLLILQSFLPLCFISSFLSFSLFRPRQAKSRPSTSPAPLLHSLSLSFLTSHSHGCLIMDTCIPCSAYYPVCCVFHLSFYHHRLKV